jgi:GDP/UDP-N,N'-diacetylbacillosamine 2-epimerase (hydrolysing)
MSGADRVDAKKVCVVTGSRAEYGLLRPLIARISADPGMTLRLAVTGMHLCHEFGYSCREIEGDGYVPDAKIEMLLSSDTAAGMAKSTGLGMMLFSEYFASDRPDILVALGDRFEIFAAATAAAMTRIPIAHICGGDTTEGAVDEFLRHSISKMSTLHFPSNEASARRLIRMGEPPDRVFNVGALNVECAMRATPLTREQLEAELGIGAGAEYALVTYHPVTLGGESSLGGFEALLEALGQFKGVSFVITGANADSGGRAINEALERHRGGGASIYAFASLGSRRYLSLMRHAKAVIGNSSSGIYEAPAFGVPAVNVGDRQKGRLCAGNVINCAPFYDDIVLAIEKAFSDEFARHAKRVTNPFGDGDASLRIVDRVNRFLRHGNGETVKSFYDPETA